MAVKKRHKRSGKGLSPRMQRSTLFTAGWRSLHGYAKHHETILNKNQEGAELLSENGRDVVNRLNRLAKNALDRADLYHKEAIAIQRQILDVCKQESEREDK